KDIITIEGFAETKRFAVIKSAFETAGAVQCGFCTPGMIIATESLLNANPHPSEAEIKIGLSGNLCRCTGYNMIVEAVQIAMKAGEGLW
ncbi:MAG: 2Fe-2S iron-sulfur cluster-binding protein, partial [Candidatus Izemoplasmatales bacterium]